MIDRLLVLSLPMLQQHPPTPSQVVALYGSQSTHLRIPSASQKHLQNIVSTHLLLTPILICVNIVYYRIYAEDGAIPSKTPVAACNPFLARINAKSVPPPRTVKVVRCSIAKVENISDRESTTLFLTPCSQTPMDDAEKVTITGLGSTPQEPLALVAKMSDSERRALESRRGGLASDAESDTMIQYRTSIQHFRAFLFVTSRLLGKVYYLLYADDYEIPSNVAIAPEVPSLGRIRADSVAPPRSPASIKRCISRVERNPALAWHGDLFVDTSCDTPLKEGHTSILRTDGPGLSPNEPMAIVVKKLSIPDGKYLIKNRAANIYWFTAGFNPITTVHFYLATMDFGENYNFVQVNKHSPTIPVFEDY